MTATLRVCNNFRFGLSSPSCALAGSVKLMAALRREIALRNLPWEVAPAPCLGYCALGPNLKARGGPLLHQCAPEAAASIIDRLQAEWRPDDDPDEEPLFDPEGPIPGL